MWCRHRRLIVALFSSFDAAAASAAALSLFTALLAQAAATAVAGLSQVDFSPFLFSVVVIAYCTVTKATLPLLWRADVVAITAG